MIMSCFGLKKARKLRSGFLAFELEEWDLFFTKTHSPLFSAADAVARFHQ